MATTDPLRTDDQIDLDGYSVTAQEAQAAIVDYLTDLRGQAVPMWPMLNKLCSHPDRSENRRERKFYLRQLKHLVHEGKVKQYWRNRPRGRRLGQPKFWIGLRGKIRISEATI